MFLFYIWSINIVLCRMDELLSAFPVIAQMWEWYVLVALLSCGSLLLQNSRKGLVLSKISYCTPEKKSDKICKWVHSIQDQRVLELAEAVAGWTYGQRAISLVLLPLRSGYNSFSSCVTAAYLFTVVLYVLFTTWSYMAKYFTFFWVNPRGSKVKQLSGICHAFLLTFNNILMPSFLCPTMTYS